eukprot:83114_1
MQNMFNGNNTTTHAIPPPLYRLQLQQHQQQQPQQSVVSQREWRQSRQSAKCKMAMDILDPFKQNHGGKLPSLRAVMKMLKVGYPKAHEILDAYLAHIGVTVSYNLYNCLLNEDVKRFCSIKCPHVNGPINFWRHQSRYR